MAISARSAFRGSVSGIHAGAINSQVATALFKAGHVLIGVPV